ncbi:NHLP leader peptide family RiPP precursor [Pleurocapsa sp. FMAR1]|uniref:NHLP leader peptide family RiPP precursor n=1 Tax=Pleurocapsa sp. FMAR1 TaxID=3040204 RepID=UPI0029C88E36|nr:NHLP leader peptide family RiPP precursor [Pleurocapsa sp. FMAR1]
MSGQTEIYQQVSHRLQSEDFKNRFVSQPKLILTEMGINIPDAVQVDVHEDTATVRNFVIPVKFADEDESVASNPLFRKAIALAHRDANFKAELINNPKSAIAQLTGESLPADLDICVYENTPTLKHLVIFVDSASEELGEKGLKTVAGGVSSIKLPGPTLGLVAPLIF